jgi:hypothetical protein
MRGVRVIGSAAQVKGETQALTTGSFKKKEVDSRKRKL